MTAITWRKKKDNMPKLANIPDNTKLLAEVYYRISTEPENTFAYAYTVAIESGKPSNSIIESLKEDLTQSHTICTMIDLLGVELVEKISNF